MREQGIRTELQGTEGGKKQVCPRRKPEKKNPCSAVSGFKARVAMQVGHSTV